MIRQHAQAIQLTTESLRQELDRIVVDAAPGSREGGAVDRESDLANALSRLVELCSRNDEVIREAFTVSSSVGTPSRIQTRQFWLSLKGAEELGAAIQAASNKFVGIPRF